MKTKSPARLLGLLTSLIATSILTPFTQAQCFVPPPGLVASWSGNGNATDNWTNRLNGVVVGQVNYAPAVSGLGFSFNGAGGHVEVSDSPALCFGTNDLTLTCWFNAPAGSTFRFILAKKDLTGIGSNLGFRIVPDGRFGFAVIECDQTSPPCGWGTTQQEVITPFRVDDGAFHHLACVRKTDGYQLYLDAQLVATRSEPARNADNTAKLCIGAMKPTGDYPFVGVIDELLLFKRALTASEVAQLFAERPCPRLSIRISQVELCWDSVTNEVYQLQYRSSLTSNVWLAFGGTVIGNGARFCTNDAVLPGEPQRYYQLVVTNSP